MPLIFADTQNPVKLYTLLADYVETVVLKGLERLAQAPRATRAIRLWVEGLRNFAQQLHPPKPDLKMLQKQLRDLAGQIPIEPHPDRKYRNPNRRPLPLGENNPFKNQRKKGSSPISSKALLLVGISIALGMIPGCSFVSQEINLKVVVEVVLGFLIGIVIGKYLYRLLLKEGIRPEPPVTGSYTAL